MTEEATIPKAADPGSGAGRPDPDPTVLTTQALYREVSGLRELIELRIEGLTDLIDEQFRRVDAQLALVESQRTEQKKDTKDAVDAALAAAKEAVKEQTMATQTAASKDVAATTKALDALAATFRTELEALRRELAAVKDTANGIASRAVGAKEDRTGLYAAVGIVVTVVIAAVAVVGVILSSNGGSP